MQLEHNSGLVSLKGCCVKPLHETPQPILKEDKDNELAWIRYDPLHISE